MKTIELTAEVGPDRKVTIELPADVAPGRHRVVVMIEEAETEQETPAKWDFPVIDIGPWPEGLSLRREDMYGDDGR